MQQKELVCKGLISPKVVVGEEESRQKLKEGVT